MNERPSPELYESTYQRRRHFSFGKNWYHFLTHINTERVERAKQSLVDFLTPEPFQQHQSFVDIGCGSGLFSLAAYRLGARPVVSVDVDAHSVASTTKLWESEGRPSDWKILRGSILDAAFVNHLGTFDIVYSWGVLHHTGDMWRAVDVVTRLVAPRGALYIALYNQRNGFQSSAFWLKVKKFYNRSPWVLKKVLEFLYLIQFFAMGLVRRENRFALIRNYQSVRGMNWYTDIVDWLGGYPYEYAKIDAVIHYLGSRGFSREKVTDCGEGVGCNEYLFIR